MAAAIDRQIAAGREHAGLSLDVDDAGGAQAVLGGQRAGDQLQRADEARIEGLAEHRDAFGDDDAVEAVLQAVVLAAGLQLAERILRHAGRLERDLVQQVVVAAGVVVDGGGGKRVGGGAGLRLDADAGGVEPGGGDDHGFDVSGVGGTTEWQSAATAVAVARRMRKRTMPSAVASPAQAVAGRTRQAWDATAAAQMRRRGVTRSDLN